MIFERRFLQAAMAYPYTWVVLMLLFGTVVGFQLWFHASPAMLLAASCLALGLLLAWLLLLVYSGDFRLWYYYRIREFSRHELGKLYQLAGEFKQLGLQAGSTQLQQLQATISEFRALISRRLNAGAFDYARLLTSAEKIYWAALARDEQLLAILRRQPQLQPQQIDAALTELRRRSGVAQTTIPADPAYRAASLLWQNEAALAALRQTMTVLGNPTPLPPKTVTQAALAQLAPWLDLQDY